MLFEFRMNKPLEIDETHLAQVRGAAGRAPIVTPMDYWTKAWTNLMSAPLTFAPPFGQPFFTGPFG